MIDNPLEYWTVDELISEVKSLKNENGHLQDEVSELRVELIARDALIDELDPANRSVGKQASNLKA